MRIVWFIVLATSLAAAEGAWAVPAPLRARQLMEAGLVHEKLGQHGLALKDFGQAIATGALPHADLVRATFDQGVALDALGRTKEAIARYSAAIGLQSDFAPALNNRGNAFRRLGRIEQAKRDYFAALKSPGAAREFNYYG